MLGATGYIGGRLVPRLLGAGYAVRVLARDPTRLGAFEWGDRVEVVAGDATDAAAVASAVPDVDVLYYLVHSMSSGKGFADADRTAAETVAEGAAAAGVGRIVYLGGLTPANVPERELSPHLRSRAEVGRIFLDSPVPAAVLRARFDALGADTADVIACYCGSGVTACHDLLALELAGHGDRTRLYAGPWSQWGAAITRPAATGPDSPTDPGR